MILTTIILKTIFGKAIGGIVGKGLIAHDALSLLDGLPPTDVHGNLPGDVHGNIPVNGHGNPPSDIWGRPTYS